MILASNISATCTWYVCNPSGFYVQDPAPGSAMTTDICSAYLWLHEDRAMAFADAMSVHGVKLAVVRARP